MKASICGIDCTRCEQKNLCRGCVRTNGQPFGAECVIAVCCHKKGYEYCKACNDTPCKLKEQLISEFKALGIKDLTKLTTLNALAGSFINLEYTLPNRQTVKILDDNRIYLGNQICKTGSERSYGLAADTNCLLVCEYGENGSEAEIIIYKKRDL